MHVPTRTPHWRALFIGLTVLVSAALAATAVAMNIDPVNKFAWNENTGWLNANPTMSPGYGLDVTSSGVTGSMWGENLGWISFSCTNRSTCATNNYGVTHDGAGHLGGYAWAENGGWISMSCANRGTCASSNYGVVIDPATGVFSGYAWGENIGWISFNCANTSSCGTSSYSVQTSWRGAACSNAVDPDCNGDVDFSNPGAGLPCVQDHGGDANGDGYSDSDEFTPAGAPTCTSAFPTSGGLGHANVDASCAGRLYASKGGTAAQDLGARKAHADVSLNNKVDLADLIIQAGQYNKLVTGPTDMRADLDLSGNGKVDLADLIIAAGLYNQFVPAC